MVYWKLFWSFFQIGLFSIGGGYAAMPLIQHQVVELTPGPIAINAATFVGTRVGGVSGALISTLGCIFPSCVIVLLLSYFYYKYRQLTLMQGILSGLRPAVVAMIASAGLSLVLLAFFGSDQLLPILQNTDFIAVGIFAASLLVLRKWKPNPIYVMLGAGAAGLLLYSVI